MPPPPGAFQDERDFEAQKQRRLAADSAQRERVAVAEKARQEAARADYEAKVAAEQKQRDDAAFAVMCDGYRQRFLAADSQATEADFARAWPGILAEHRRRSALGEPTPDVVGKVTVEMERDHLLATNRRL